MVDLRLDVLVSIFHVKPFCLFQYKSQVVWNLNWGKFKILMKFLKSMTPFGKVFFTFLKFKSAIAANKRERFESIKMTNLTFNLTLRWINKEIISQIYHRRGKFCNVDTFHLTNKCPIEMNNCSVDSPRQFQTWRIVKIYRRSEGFQGWGVIAPESWLFDFFFSKTVCLISDIAKYKNVPREISRRKHSISDPTGSTLDCRKMASD